MASDEGRAAARRAVSGEMSRRGWNPGDLAREAGVDPGTVGDFLSGARWPKLRTFGRIEAALGWEPGSITAHADGAPPPSAVGDTGQDAVGVALDLPAEALEGLTPIEREELVAALRLRALEKAREIRSRN